MKGWRTLALNLFGVMLPVLQATGAADLGLEGQWALAYGSALALANFILRFFTNTSVGSNG